MLSIPEDQRIEQGPDEEWGFQGQTTLREPVPKSMHISLSQHRRRMGQLNPFQIERVCHFRLAVELPCIGFLCLWENFAAHQFMVKKAEWAPKAGNRLKRTSEGLQNEASNGIVNRKFGVAIFLCRGEACSDSPD